MLRASEFLDNRLTGQASGLVSSVLPRLPGHVRHAQLAGRSRHGKTALLAPAFHLSLKRGGLTMRAGNFARLFDNFLREYCRQKLPVSHFVGGFHYVPTSPHYTTGTRGYLFG